jgi:hypothetical protein
VANLKLPPKRKAWEKELGSSGEFNASNPLSLLSMVADNLNTFVGIEDDYTDPDESTRELGSAWALAAAIVSEPTLPKKIAAFNRVAETAMFQLKVDEGADRIRLTRGAGGKATLRRSGRRFPLARIVRAPGPGRVHAEVVRYLWHWLRDAEYRRLKLCPQCEKWFVDVTRPGNAKRCATACTWRWNNRKRQPKRRT